MWKHQPPLFLFTVATMSCIHIKIADVSDSHQLRDCYRYVPVLATRDLAALLGSVVGQRCCSHLHLVPAVGNSAVCTHRTIDVFMGVLLLGVWLYAIVDAPFTASRTPKSAGGGPVIDKTGWEV